MSSTAHPPRQPLLACASAIETALTSVTQSEPTYLTASEKADLLRRLTVIEARTAELRLRLMAAAGDVAEASGARDVGSWLAAETRQGFEAPRADQALAAALDRDHPLVREALRDGLLNLAQVRVIVAALDALPADLDGEIRQQAAKTLVALAGEHTPRDLRILGRRILEIVAPEIAEAEEARRLADEEAHARGATKLALKPLGDGTTRLSGLLPTAAADRLATYLHSFTNPRRSDDPGTEAYAGSYPRRLGQAFCSLLEAIDPRRLPVQGGDATTVVVTIGLDQLKADLGVGELIPWATGGPTDLRNGVLLCCHHHHRVHDAAYTSERLANGDVRFTRRS